MKRLLSLTTLLILALLLASCGGKATQSADATPAASISADDTAQSASDNNSDTNDSDEEATEAPEQAEPTPAPAEPTGQPTAVPLVESPAKTSYAIGDTARIGPFRVRLNSAKTAASTEMGEASAGNQFMLLNITVENASAQDQTMALLFQVLRDGQGKNIQIDPGASMDGVVNVNGNVHPGEQKTGTIGYQVPTGAHAYTWQFTAVQGDGSKSAQGSFDLPAQ